MDSKVFSRGAELSHKTTTHIPADAKIRPLRDQIIVEPIDSAFSSIICVINECKPLRGVVRAVGPGVYPIQYDHAEKHRRTKMWWGKKFRPCDVKVGDIVNFGGIERGGIPFQCIYWGDKICLIAREEDVCAIEGRHEQAA